MAIDPEQSQLRMVPGGDGVVYSVQADGRLLFYRHLGWQTGTAEWANGGNGVQINAGWHMFTTVLAAADGQLFGFAEDGTVRWYRYLRDSGTWAPGGAAVIGVGFDRYPRITGGWDGIFYATDRSGDLYWFRYLAGDGSTGGGAWANGGQPLLIKRGVGHFHEFVADQGGVLYGVRQGEELHWLRHDGGGTWANGGVSVPIGTGWTGEYQRDFIAQGGSLYTVFIDRASPPGPDHELNWFRLVNWRDIPLGGTPNWANGGVGRPVGTGWTTCRTANLQGYPSALSTPTGGSVGIKVSSTFSSYQLTVQRLEGPLPDGGTTVWGPVTVAGRLQPVQAGYRRAGCGWADDVTVPIPASWSSGLYTATLAGPLGMRRQVPFVVKPAAPTRQLAVLLPTLTHNAYNSWGGHSQYTWDIVPTNRYITLRRPADAVLQAPGRVNARWYSDLLLLRWLKANTFAYDCYQDVDLHFGDWLGSYKALLLCTHPEYWTLTMRTKLADYVQAGGRVVSTGGNVLYEPVDLADGGATAVHRDPFGNRVSYEAHGLPAHEIIGNTYTDDSWFSFAPYQVAVPDHPFFAGTGVAAGDSFGQTGVNGAAAGWEMDVTPSGLAGATVIASGAQAGGADMVHFTRGAGWAFAVGSLTFNGALADPVVSRVLRNALTAALA
ncbi:hypothetical protein GCM10010492_44060 [Saccharothrix mutabilis subsp. mutabilis]|uniref:Tachylectin 2 domain-containing protein n=1 Tax=Saccharothrix mutabilis subsp. mutabilis TaxID=66855 RepID=A0ABN0U6A6_9PSEU